jgi:hypothetical protein
MTIVAEVKRPEITAREEATTAMEGMLAVAIVASFWWGLALSCTPFGLEYPKELDEWSVVAARWIRLESR